MTLKNIFFFFPILLIVSCRTKQENKKVMESEKSKIEKKSLTLQLIRIFHIGQIQLTDFLRLILTLFQLEKISLDL